MQTKEKIIAEMFDTIEDEFKDAEAHIMYAIDARDDGDMEVMQMHKQDAQTRMEELRRWCDVAKKKFGEGGVGEIMCKAFGKRRDMLAEKMKKIDEK